MAKEKKRKFQPFIHENLEIKNELLQLARNARTGERKLENDLASVLIYSNIAEYLAENLLQTLSHFIYQSSYKDFAGILFIEPIFPLGKKTLNQTIDEIEKFSFPDKESILGCLREVAKARNKIFHNFAKSDLDTIKQLLNDDLHIIQDECEEVIRKINTIYAGLNKILNPQASAPADSDASQK